MSGRDPRDHRGGVDAAKHNDDFEQVVDPDVDLHAARQRRETRPRQWDLVTVCSAGGILGAWARYGLGLAVPHSTHQFPWSVVLINVTGCLLIGSLMVVLLELTSPHRLVRPFLGVGVLGGYTTYSTFAVDVERLALSHQAGLAASYVVVTALACAGAVWLSTTLTLNAGRAVIAARVRRRHPARSTR